MEMPEDVVLIFAGGKHPDDNTDYVPNLIQLIKDRGVGERVRITGFLPRERLQDVLAATDVAIAPYHSSSGSGAVALLLAAGIPTITSDISVFQEIVNESPHSMILSPAHRPDLLRKQISQVLDQPELRLALIEGAKEYSTSHSYTELAVATERVYHEVLAKCV